ncbi:MAG TPA: phage holin family protein [Candidatus Acidoferrum sp.]|nr:phage holin family protein [Candidatus Acidoferrum sp.]
MGAPQTQRSVSDVLQDIVANLQQIIRAEFRLVTVEIREKADRASKPVMVLASGIVLGFFGLGFLLLAAVYGLSLVMAPWLASLLVGGALAITSAVLVGSGRNALGQIEPVPEKTIRTVKENVQWAKEQIK